MRIKSLLALVALVSSTSFLGYACGGGGGGSTGTGSTSGTGGISSATGGNNGATGGTSGTGGAPSADDCMTICLKAQKCCVAIAPRIGEEVSSCDSYATAPCAEPSVVNLTTATCQSLLTHGAAFPDPPAACK